MPTETTMIDLTHTIQLAVAPVFLLTALGTLLSVLSARLTRIVDRARILSGRDPAVDEKVRAEHNEEMHALSRRRNLINYAITSAVLAALQVCLLVGVAFVGFLLHTNFSFAIAGLFLGAMAAYIMALVLFLREILVAVAGARMRPMPRA